MNAFRLIKPVIIIILLISAVCINFRPSKLANEFNSYERSVFDFTVPGESNHLYSCNNNSGITDFHTLENPALIGNAAADGRSGISAGNYNQIYKRIMIR